MATNLIMAGKSNSNHSIWHLIREHLESKKSQVAEEILYYPPPIPACDAQFNFLLAERARVSQALVQLDGMAHDEFPRREELLAFVSSLPEWDEALGAKLKAVLGE